MTITLADIVARVQGSFSGDGSLIIRAVAGLREAQPGDLSFLSNPKYKSLLQHTRATAVLVPRGTTLPSPALLIEVDKPDPAFASVTELFRPPAIQYAPGIHASAVIAATARIGHGAHVGPFVHVQDGAVIGDRCILEAGAVVGHQARLGDDVHLYAGAVLRENVIIGNRVILHNNSVVGSDGFGYTVDAAGVRTKVPQVGIVRVGDDVEIGANVCIDRARFGETRIGNGVKIDNLVQIAHNVVIGDHVVLVAQVGISGSTVVGPHAILAGQVGVAGHLSIGEKAVVGAQGGVTKDVAPGTYVWGTPAAPFDKYSKSLSHINRLPKLLERLSELEKKLAALEKANQSS